MIRVVTTTSKAGFNEYGKKMLDTFERYWPPEIKLLFYNEDLPDETFHRYKKNVSMQHFPGWFYRWKSSWANVADANGRDPKKNREGRPYDFRRDCIKFSHKVAALTDAALDMDDGLLIWMDGDTLSHQPISEDWIYSLFPALDKEDRYMAWLARRRGHPECGFLMFRCWHPAHHRYMTEMQRIYETGDIFKVSETHDSFIFQHVAIRAMKEGWLPEPYNLSGQAMIFHHPFVHCELGSRLDHAKGARKKHGRTPRVEVGMRRREAHWK